MFMFFNDLIVRALCVKAEMDLSSLRKSTKEYNEAMKKMEERNKKKTNLSATITNTKTRQFFDFVSKIDTLNEKELNEQLNEFIDADGNLTFTINLEELRGAGDDDIIDTTGTFVDEGKKTVSLKEALNMAGVGKMLFTEYDEHGNAIPTGTV